MWVYTRARFTDYGIDTFDWIWRSVFEQKKNFHPSASYGVPHSTHLFDGWLKEIAFLVTLLFRYFIYCRRTLTWKLGASNFSWYGWRCLKINFFLRPDLLYPKIAWDEQQKWYRCETFSLCLRVLTVRARAAVTVHFG